ncbi:MAG: 1,2-phenylacetyl-CoA epoxidase subunit PaaD [Ignavibacteria bacterium]
MITKEEILKVLEEVKDPEIPTISVVDLGIITDIKITEDGFVSITMTPTFTGCPALKVLEKSVKEKLEQLNVKGADVKTAFDVSWNTNMITQKGKEMLKKHRLAPPVKHQGLIEADILKKVKCPYCGSKETTLNSLFGSTLCRSMHYCNNCLQAFEQFKPVV